MLKSLLAKYRLGILLLILALFRMFHISGPVDDPHAWRQLDTKQYIDSYYYDQAPFLKPSVCWMGGHKTLILEFPLPEYLVAELHEIFGPSLIVERLFFLGFFLLAMYFFYKSLELIFDNYVPLLATFIAGLAPLSLFYSRAIHIDFFAIAFSLGMLYFCMYAIRFKDKRSLLLSILFASVAFLTKAPYAFYFAIPIVVFAFQEKQVHWFFKRSIGFLLPVLLLLLWVKYSKITNEKIPDWSFIPNFNRFTEMWYWYFGTMQQRSIGANWITIGDRIFIEILGYSGSLLFLLGAIFCKKNKSYFWSLSLLVGTLIYLLIFFNLNLMHNYYQLPFVLPLAIFCAMGIQWMIGKSKRFGSFSMAVPLVCLAFFTIESVRYAETNYYVIHEDVTKVADEIAKFTNREDLVIVSYQGLTPQCPLVLQPAGRYGWSIPTNDLTPELIYELYKKAGARKLAVVYYGYFEGEFRYFYEGMIVKKSVRINKDGLNLYLCDLDLDSR